MTDKKLPLSVRPPQKIKSIHYKTLLPLQFAQKGLAYALGKM
jgi:hypothetical protein